LTFDLQSGSPAADAISNGVVNVDFPPLDQRGFPRPINQIADIGAVETGTPSFSISGFLTPNIFKAYTNVVINAVGTGLTYSTMPNAVGAYSFPSLPPDIYTITPQPTNGFSFSPVNLMVTLAVTNQTSLNNNFVATPSFTVSGLISNLLATATVQIFVATNGNNVFYRQTTTAANGIYTFTNVPNQNYLIAPVTTSTTAFSPSNLVVTNLLADNTNLNFNAVPPTFTVNGKIQNTGGTIITVNASSSVAASTKTDAGGNYTLNLIQGNYTVTPQAAGFTFSPASILVAVPPATNLMDFIAQGSAFSLSGQITNIQGVVMLTAVSGANNYSTASGVNGSYTFPAVVPGTYTVTPQPTTGLSFTPASGSVTVASVTNAPGFTAVISYYTISGQVLLGTNGSKAYPNVTVIGSGTNAFTSTNTYSALTDGSGNYTLTGLPAASYLVNAQPTGFFTPSNSPVSSLSGAVANINFRLTDTNSTLLIIRSNNSPALTVSFKKWVPNTTYRIQTSTNRTTWQDVATNTPGTNTSTVPVSLDSGTNHYFRAVTP
jgi:hypothetical protein